MRAEVQAHFQLLIFMFKINCFLEMGVGQQIVHRVSLPRPTCQLLLLVAFHLSFQGPCTLVILLLSKN
jgi:hypothetical protein